jgi:tetratricopeptide (TPR) repeat protein
LTDWNRKLVLESMIRRLQQPPLSSQPNNAARLRQLREREQALLAGMNPESAANAKALYADVIAAHPEDHFLHEAFGNFLQLVGDVPGAIREWQAVGELLPHDFLPWFQIGVMQSRQGHHSEARTNLRRALNIRPGLVEGWLELGRSLGAESKWESASQAFQRACELRPQDPVLWASRAKSAGELGRRAEAIAFYQRAVELRPGYWEARGALGDLFAQAGRIAEAAAQYEAAIKAKPDFAMGHFNLGVMFARQGRLDAAIGEFQTAVRLEPGNQAAAEYLERVQEQRGRKP